MEKYLTKLHSAVNPPEKKVQRTSWFTTAKKAIKASVLGGVTALGILSGTREAEARPAETPQEVVGVQKTYEDNNTPTIADGNETKFDVSTLADGSLFFDARRMTATGSQRGHYRRDVPKLISSGRIMILAMLSNGATVTIPVSKEGFIHVTKQDPLYARLFGNDGRFAVKSFEIGTMDGKPLIFDVLAAAPAGDAMQQLMHQTITETQPIVAPSVVTVPQSTPQPSVLQSASPLTVPSIQTPKQKTHQPSTPWGWIAGMSAAALAGLGIREVLKKKAIVPPPFEAIEKEFAAIAPFVTQDAILDPLREDRMETHAFDEGNKTLHETVRLRQLVENLEGHLHVYAATRSLTAMMQVDETDDQMREKKMFEEYKEASYALQYLYNKVYKTQELFSMMEPDRNYLREQGIESYLSRHMVQQGYVHINTEAEGEQFNSFYSYLRYAHPWMVSGAGYGRHMLLHQDLLDVYKKGLTHGAMGIENALLHKVTRSGKLPLIDAHEFYKSLRSVFTAVEQQPTYAAQDTF